MDTDGARKTDPKSSLEKLTADIEHLPVMPKVGTQLFQLLKDENRNAAKIAEVISTDPSLTAQILKVANSAHYQRQSKITTLKHAVAMIGVSEIEKMALALCSGALNRQQLCSELDVDLSEFTAHSIMTAQLSSQQPPCLPMTLLFRSLPRFCLICGRESENERTKRKRKKKVFILAFHL
jgi:HD-like signal output (HDOD) protein